MTNSATSHLLPVFARADLGFERGEGCWLIATDGERYLDFTRGVAVNALGHCHPHLVAALQEQATKLWHMSNLFKSPDGERLAARLCEQSFADFVFFANSGAEAMECAIKVTRKYHAAKGDPERYRIITFDGAFHGRTLATLAATGSPKYLEGFGPPVEGFDQVPLGDLEAVKKAIGPHTAGILIEPLQGEGGVRAAPHAFFKALRQLCDDKGLLLVFDEVQTGIGRTGKLFAYQHAGVKPDIMTLAKALGGGLPIGAMIARTEIAQSLTPGSHGSTFGGNPVSCAAALAVLDALEHDGAMENAASVGGYMLERLRKFAQGCDRVVEVRGLGMMIGIVLRGEAKSVADACLRERLLVNATAENVLRMLPPLTLTRDEADAGLKIIERALSTAPAAAPAAAR